MFLALLIGLAAGCRTAGTLPRANLKEPGWTVRQGQAVWTHKRGGEGIAGDIIVATRPDGQAFVQFSKGLFPVFVGQLTARAWSISIPPQNLRYSGHGQPPKRVLLLYLPRVLSGLPPPRHWTWQRVGEGGWKLENQSSGESLEVYFNP